jgi:putative flavoprotein involved in K+ transport
MKEYIDTIIVGGGQAGLAVSYYLTQQGRPHVVLEQSSQSANAWRNHRWDSFTFVTPNWMTRLPGVEYQGADRDGFMSRSEIVTFFQQYVERFKLPVRYDVQVTAIEQDSGSYTVTTSKGAFQSANVVIATGLFQKPKIPSFSAQFPPEITQLHSSEYRNPDALPAGAVLVIGSGQSGCQVAEELSRTRRNVYLSVGSTGRVPRRYRGKDIFGWLDEIGLANRTVDQLKSPRDKFRSNPHLSGTSGGHSVNLHQFARDGVVLLGHISGLKNSCVYFAPDLRENLAKADQFEADLIRTIDNYIEKNGLNVPKEELSQLTDGFKAELIRELDLMSARIQSVIWATGFTFDFSLVRLPVSDSDGYPIQKRGITKYPGLYFVGLPWIHNAKSGLLFGIGEDAAFIAANIEARNSNRQRISDCGGQGYQLASELANECCIA